MIDAARRALLAKRVAAATAAAQVTVERAGGGPSRRADPRRAVLNEQQQTSWSHQREHPESTINNLGLYFRFGPGVQTAPLVAAIRGFVGLHELLRTTYRTAGGESWQVVHDELAPRIEIDGTGSAGTGSEGELAEALRRHLALPFDLASEGPLRAVIFCDPQVDAGRAAQSMLLVIHHIIWDAATFERMTRDLDTLYRDADVGLEPDPVQYADYAEWCARQPPARRERGLEHWERVLTALPPLPLRGDVADGRPVSERGARHDRPLSPAVVAGLTELAQRHGTTRFVAFTAVLGRLLAERSGATEICLGTLMSLRETPAVQAMVGDFATLAPLRFAVDGERRQTIAAADTAFRGALDHGGVGYRAIARRVGGIGTAARPTAFDVVIVFIEGELAGPRFGSPTTTWERVENANVQFPIVPLGIEVFLRADRPQLQFTYSPEVITERQVGELADRLCASLEAQR